MRHLRRFDLVRSLRIPANLIIFLSTPKATDHLAFATFPICTGVRDCFRRDLASHHVVAPTLATLGQRRNRFGNWFPFDLAFRAALKSKTKYYGSIFFANWTATDE